MIDYIELNVGIIIFCCFVIVAVLLYAGVHFLLNWKLENENRYDHIDAFIKTKSELYQTKILELQESFYYKLEGVKKQEEPNITIHNLLKILDQLTEIKYPYKMNVNVFKIDDEGNILIVQDPTNLTFYGIGDTIIHYFDEKAEIVKIKKGHEYPTYNYFPLNEDLGIELRKSWTKHNSSFSNISTVIHCENTLNFMKNWLEIEENRRRELPRYIVKISYPESTYSVGQIIEPFDKIKYQLNQDIVNFCEKYPDVFEKVSTDLADVVDKIGILDVDFISS